MTEIVFYYMEVIITNETEGCVVDREDIDLEDLNMDNMFRACQEQYGRCIGKMYIDCFDGREHLNIGWVFERRVKYDDSDETYISHVWVSFKEIRKNVSVLSFEDTRKKVHQLYPEKGG